MFDDVVKIYIRRTLLVPPLAVASSDMEKSHSLVAAGLQNLQRAGLTVDAELASNILAAKSGDFLDFYGSALQVAKELLGDTHSYEPMYPNFPDQVADASDAELYLNAVLHYVGDVVGARITPVYEKKARGAFNPTPGRVLRLGAWDGVSQLFASIMSSSQPFADVDKSDLRTFVRVKGEDRLVQLFPDEFPVKENLAYLTVLVGNGGKGDLTALTRHYRTATDVLRLAVVLSGGEANLVSRKVRFKSFTRPERRLLMTLLNSASNLVEDMDRRPEQFKRLGERLHPGEFAKTYPGVVEAFRTIRSGVKVDTYNKRVEAQLRKASASGVVPDELLNELSSRPGDFARRLDHVVRIAGSEDEQLKVVKAFSHVVEKVSVKVLFQLGNAYLNRNGGRERITITRGGNSVTLADPLPPLASDKVPTRIVKAVGVGLRHHFAERSPLGKVWVDPELKNYTVPLSVQGASADADMMGRFSRLPVAADVSTLRFFLHWKDRDRQRIDLDLSALFLNTDFRQMGTLSYVNLRHGGYALHSGDFTSAPHGASEFVDIDISKALADGVRYVVMDVRNYTQSSFEGIPECFAGFMGRSNPGSGEVFEPSTVANKVALTSEADTAMIYVFDLKKREAIWCDFTISNIRSSVNNLLGNANLVGRVARIAVSNDHLSLYDLFMLHGSARGTVVDNHDEADVVFGDGGKVTASDTARILSEYM